MSNTDKHIPTTENRFDESKYKWKGLNPRIGKAYYFRWTPNVIRGANFIEIQFMWIRLSLSWFWNHHAIWNDGWDACFRQNMYKDEIIESTKVFNRKN